MGRCRELTIECRAQIVILLILRKENKSLRYIAKKLNIAHSTVVATMKRVDELKTFSSRVRSGRLTVTSEIAFFILSDVTVGLPERTREENVFSSSGRNLSNQS